MEEKVILTNSQWSVKDRGWECPQLLVPGINLKEVEIYDSQDWELLKRNRLFKRKVIIKWKGKWPPPDTITVIISSDFSAYERAILRNNKKTLIIAIASVAVALISIFKNDLVTRYQKLRISDKRGSPVPSGRSVNIISKQDRKYIPNCGTISLKNAEFETYNDSSLIMLALDKDTWDECNRMGKPCYCYPYHQRDSGIKYGFLYNSYAAMTTEHGGIIPVGWALFHNADVGKLRAIWPNTGYILKGKKGWSKRPNRTSGNGIDSIGFDAEAGGGYCTPDFTFRGVDTMTGWWTRDIDYTDGYPDFVRYYFWSVQTDDDSASWHEAQRQYGFYIRCIEKANE